MDVLQIQKDLIGMQDYMKNFARTLTKDEADAEDLTQDTTLRVFLQVKKSSTLTPKLEVIAQQSLYSSGAIDRTL